MSTNQEHDNTNRNLVIGIVIISAIIIFSFAWYYSEQGTVSCRLWAEKLVEDSKDPLAYIDRDYYQEVEDFKAYCQ